MLLSRQNPLLIRGIDRPHARFLLRSGLVVPSWMDGWIDRVELEEVPPLLHRYLASQPGETVSSKQGKALPVAWRNMAPRTRPPTAISRAWGSRGTWRHKTIRSSDFSRLALRTAPFGSPHWGGAQHAVVVQPLNWIEIWIFHLNFLV